MDLMVTLGVEGTGQGCLGKHATRDGAVVLSLG
jgi:hypothetical protein